MMHFVFHFGTSKSLQTLINKVSLHMCLATMIIIPAFFFEGPMISPSFCNESVTELRMRPGCSAHTAYLLHRVNLPVKVSISVK